MLCLNELQDIANRKWRFDRAVEAHNDATEWIEHRTYEGKRDMVKGLVRIEGVYEQGMIDLLDAMHRASAGNDVAREFIRVVRQGINL